MEHEIPVAGPAIFPWGKPHGHPYGPHPMGEVGNTLIRGCTALGIPVSAGGPVAILSASHGSRPHCIYRGFCIQGCKVGAKASTLITHVPDALANGAEIRDHAMVFRISMGADGHANGVHYFDEEGKEHLQRARAVIVCGYALETPRLLLNSACAGHEQGLANSSGMVGKFLMAQAGNVILGKFDHLIRQYKAPPAHALTEEFYETDDARDFARGFAVQTVGPLPIAFAKQMMAAKKLWGWGLRREMMDYNHWSPLGLLGEILPWEDNRVEIADGKDGRHDACDRFGLPVAQVTFSLKENDKKLIEFGKNKVMEIMGAAGAVEVVQEQRYAHLVGGARMSADPSCGVCDKFGRTWDVPNLFVMDGSVMPTQGSANPGLTIQSLAARTAHYLMEQGEAVFTSGSRRLKEPACRPSFSPPVW
jgi:choline dehydrogenase-like flavoprotein